MKWLFYIAFPFVVMSLLTCVRQVRKEKKRKVIIVTNSTFAVSVGTSEDGALLDAAEGLKEAPHVIF